MLKNPLMRVHCKFAKALGERVLFWAYHWLRGHGGYFIKRDGKVERLPPGMRLAEAPDFTLEYLRRLAELRSKPREYFQDVIEYAEKHLSKDEVIYNRALVSCLRSAVRPSTGGVARPCYVVVMRSLSVVRSH